MWKSPHSTAEQKVYFLWRKQWKNHQKWNPKIISGNHPKLSIGPSLVHLPILPLAGGDQELANLAGHTTLVFFLHLSSFVFVFVYLCLCLCLCLCHGRRRPKACKPRWPYQPSGFLYVFCLCLCKWAEFRIATF